ncbi:MAG: diguanylate cyclase [Anaerolineae bacterium]|nr:MAG: diguanylate cyclase [Anaerolineae bacterium]
MELRTYLNIFIRRWWIIVPLIFISLTGAFLFAYSQTPIYESTSKYVATLSQNFSGDSDATIYALDTLAGRQRIFVTYCEVIVSDSVRQEVYSLLNLNPNDPATAKILKDYKVVCTNLPETNILLLTVQGPSPQLVTNMNDAIGLVGMAHANRLYTYFPVQRLDPVYLEEDPVSPKYMQTGALGGAFGLILGITAALMIEYLRRPGDAIHDLSIRNREIGIYNERYFRQRFAEELERASVRMRPISMAVLKLHPDEDFALFPEAAQRVVIRGAALKLEDSVGQGNMVAYLRGQTFGILLTETPGEEAVNVINRLHVAIRSQPFEAEGGFVTNFSANSGLVSSSGSLLGFNDMYDKAMEALRVAEQNGENTVHLINATPPPFLSTQETQQIDLKPRGKGAASSPFTAEADDYGVGSGWDLDEDTPTQNPTSRIPLNENTPTVTLEPSANIESLLELADEIARPEIHQADEEEKKREELRAMKRNVSSSLLRRLTDKDNPKNNE